jgi:hypothetical protein
LDQVLAGEAVAGPKAAGQPVGQAQVSEDDPFAQLRVSGALVVEEPLLDLLDGALVTGADP